MSNSFPFQGSNVGPVYVLGSLNVGSLNGVVAEKTFICNIHILSGAGEHHDVLTCPSLNGGLLLTFGVQFLIPSDSVEKQPVCLLVAGVTN